MEGYPLFYLLKVKNSKGLYLHVDATIKAPERGASLERNHDFEGISLQFLQGTGNLFCRAEWDVKKKNDKLTHPQPHWLWGYVGKEEEFDLFNPTETDAIPEGGFLQEIVDNTSTLPNIDFEELHYAMAARWTVQDSAVEEFTVQRLQTWMKNCIKNVIDQYNYQVNKGGFVSSKEW